MALMKDKNKSLAIHSSIMPHMSNVTRAFILCLLLWLCGACAALEGEPKHVSAKEFMEYASLPMGTMVFSKPSSQVGYAPRTIFQAQ
jgi:hypothetical protein